MAGLNFTLSATLSSGTAAKTFVLVQAPSNHKLRVVGWKVSCAGTNPNQTPIKSELRVGHSDYGTLVVGSAVKWNTDDSETVQSGLRINENTPDTEPTGGSTIFADETPAAGGTWEVRYPQGQGILVVGGGRVSLRLTADTTTTCVAELYVEE